MAICKTCGTKYSKWTTPVSARGVCRACFLAELSNEREVEPQQQVPSTPEKPAQEQTTPDGFVFLGYYRPREASKLLERFQQNNITFHAQPRRMGTVNTNAGVTLLISIDPKRSDDVDKIHRELFGDGLPNYDSSFFRDHRNV